MLEPSALNAVCGTLPSAPENRVWFRAVRPQFWQTGLQTAQSRVSPGRFNAGAIAASPFETLYLAENAMVALFEVQALLGNPTTPGGVISPPLGAWIVLNVSVRLNQVADLTDLTVQNALNTTAQELTGDWRGYQQRSHGTTVKSPIGLAPTQQLGQSLFAVAGLEGFRTLSARIPYHEALVVFPQKMQPGSFIRFSDPATGQSLFIP